MSRDEPLERAGWRLAEEDDPPTPYDRFVRCLGFSLQGESLIVPPAGSVGIDFSSPHAGTEFGLRRALVECFLTCSAGTPCVAICVNFGQWEFVPKSLALTSHFEPFPVQVTPWAEYVLFADHAFSHGLFCNPWNLHMVVFGEPFVRRFSDLHADRLAPVEVAAASRHFTR